jgi:hypothetical protein
MRRDRGCLSLSKDVPCAGARFSCAARIFLGSQGVPQRELTLEIAAFLRSCDGVPPCRLPSTGTRRTGDVAAGIGTQASSRGFSLFDLQALQGPAPRRQTLRARAIVSSRTDELHQGKPEPTGLPSLNPCARRNAEPCVAWSHGGKTGLPLVGRPIA